jgi:hypothetical protein
MARPAMLWMLSSLWSWNDVIFSVVSATAGMLIAPIRLERLAPPVANHRIQLKTEIGIAY